MPTGLIRRGASYSLRRRVPKELLAAYHPQKEITRALGTKDREEAKRLHALAWVALDQEFAEARLLEPRDEPTRLRQKLKQIFDARDAAAIQPQTMTSGEVDDVLESMAIQSAEELREEVLYERREFPRQQIYAVRSVEDVETLSERDRAMRDILEDNAIQIEKLERELRLAQRKKAQASAASIVPSPALPPVSSQSPDASFSAVVRRWERERTPKASTVEAHVALTRWFIEATGINLVTDVERQHVQAFKSALIEKGTSASNIKTKLSRLRTILNFAVAEGLLSANPGVGVKAPISKGPRPVAPWRVAELNKLFAGPVHHDGERPVRGRGEAAYWLPLLALFTGARREELGQLRGRDIVLLTYSTPDGDAEAWAINIDYGADGENQLKTAASQRVVPIHSSLLALGFVDFAKKAADQDLIFSQLRPNGDGKLTEKWGDWFREYRRQVGISDPRLKFHSFRHAFKDYCREASINEGVQRQLMGHSAADVAEQYGSGFSTHQLVCAMQSYRVAGLSLPKPPS